MIRKSQNPNAILKIPNPVGGQIYFHGIISKKCQRSPFFLILRDFRAFYFSSWQFINEGPGFFRTSSGGGCGQIKILMPTGHYTISALDVNSVASHKPPNCPKGPRPNYADLKKRTQRSLGGRGSRGCVRFLKLAFYEPKCVIVTFSVAVRKTAIIHKVSSKQSLQNCTHVCTRLVSHYVQNFK